MELSKILLVVFANVEDLVIHVQEHSLTVLLVLMAALFYMIMHASVTVLLRHTQQVQHAYHAKIKIALTVLQVNASNAQRVIYYIMDFVLNHVLMELIKLQMTIPVAYVQQAVNYASLILYANLAMVAF